MLWGLPKWASGGLAQEKVIVTGFDLHGITDGCRSPGSSPNSAIDML